MRNQNEIIRLSVQAGVSGTTRCWAQYKIMMGVSGSQEKTPCDQLRLLWPVAPRDQLKHIKKRVNTIQGQGRVKKVPQIPCIYCYRSRESAQVSSICDRSVLFHLCERRDVK
jgi:hypothetical protein